MKLSAVIFWHYRVYSSKDENRLLLDSIQYRWSFCLELSSQVNDDCQLYRNFW